MFAGELFLESEHVSQQKSKRKSAEKLQVTVKKFHQFAACFGVNLL